MFWLILVNIIWIVYVGFAWVPRLFGKLEIVVSVKNNLVTLVVGMFFFVIWLIYVIFMQNEVNKKIMHDGADRTQQVSKDNFHMKPRWPAGLDQIKSLCGCAHAFISVVFGKLGCG